MTRGRRVDRGARAPCAFYRDGLERFDATDFRRAKTLNGFGNRVREDVRPNFVDIGDHERTHVDGLTATVEDLGGDPVEEACYDFGVEDADDFIAVAVVLENTGASAYDGSISLVSPADLLETGATTRSRSRSTTRRRWTRSCSRRAGSSSTVTDRASVRGRDEVDGTRAARVSARTLARVAGN